MTPEKVRAARAGAERVTDWLERGEASLRNGSAMDFSGLTTADLRALIGLADAACACGGEHHCERDVAAVREAARVLVYEHNLRDFIYSVRASAAEGDASFEGNSWQHPKVISFAKAVETLHSFAGPPVRARAQGGFTLSPEAAAQFLAAVPCPGCGALAGHLPGCRR